MMKKDKKPFTYTPGGIDLSEIKSPRMARRIERNANLPGVDEISRVNQPQQTVPHAPLPPSALAAMQPALPVQVFPSGAPLPPQPPPPPPKHTIPGPPPPPMPTNATSNGQQAYERPDMTRIIPENPMALLRKAPKLQRKTFLDELYESGNVNTPATPPAAIRNTGQPFSECQEQKRTPSPPTKTSTAQLGSLQMPQSNNVQQVRTPPTPASPPSPPQRQQQSTPQSPQSPALNKAPTPWLTQKHEKQQEVPAWAVKDPPQARQSPPYNEQDNTIYNNVQHSPPIQKNEPSPRPWTQQPQQQPVVQPPQVQQPLRQPQQIPQQSQVYVPQQYQQPIQQQQQQQQQNSGPRPWSQQSPQQQQERRPLATNIPKDSPGIIKVEPPNYNKPNENVEVVYVTQPAVYQHPGVSQQKQQPPTNQQEQGNRVVPIQIERNSSQKQTNERYV